MLLHLHYAHPHWFLLTLLIVPILWFAKLRRNSLGHSQVSIHGNLRSIPVLGWAATFFLVLFIAGLSITAAQPQQTHIINLHVLARDFVITVDVSSSMSSELTDPEMKKFAAPSQPPTAAKPPAADPTANPFAYGYGYGEGEDEDGDGGPPPPKGPTRAMGAREGVKQFLEHRQGDRVALILFDDSVHFSEPLGFNIKAVQNKLDDILYSGGGTNFDGPSKGSPNVGAIQGSIRHFRERSTSKTKVLIMVTDGEDQIQPERADALARQMQQLHIKMYVIGVGESWLRSEPLDLQKFVERPEINGLVFKVSDAKQLREGFAKIDQLEKADTEVGGTEVKEELYPVCAEITLVILFCLLLSAALVREEV
jgi:hypothetical protein